MGGHQTLFQAGNSCKRCYKDETLTARSTSRCLVHKPSRDDSLSQVTFVSVHVSGDQTDVRVGARPGCAGEPVRTDPGAVGGSGSVVLRAVSGGNAAQFFSEKANACMMLRLKHTFHGFPGSHPGSGGVCRGDGSWREGPGGRGRR